MYKDMPSFFHGHQGLVPVLAYPNLDGHFIIDTDARGFAIGAFLAQVQGGIERLIVYFSHAH